MEGRGYEGGADALAGRKEVMGGSSSDDPNKCKMKEGTVVCTYLMHLGLIINSRNE